MDDPIDNGIQQVAQARYEMANQIKHQAPRMIWVTFQKEGIHSYPASADDPDLATGNEYDVSFLAWPHRHIFHFKVWISVFHNDREIEFIQFKRWLENLYGDKILDLTNKSCEMISDILYDKIAERYPNRDVWISVSEDDENGSFIKYNRIMTLT